ncbi:hypothetical protein DFH09DRAFT_939324 [Mycena vulgaris]|nr:hypothetical protein DFH09DRAFT_939324 [Mycena vulgaris]
MPPSPTTRPATISELAAVAQSGPDAPASNNLDLKHYLRRADRCWTDMERAFVEYATAATLIVEKIPGRRDYGSGLTAKQKANLTALSPSLHQSSFSWRRTLG